MAKGCTSKSHRSVQLFAVLCALQLMTPEDSGYVLANNTMLNETYSHFESPVISFSEIESDGYSKWCPYHGDQKIAYWICRIECQGNPTTPNG
jgi:hypothetical protein